MDDKTLVERFRDLFEAFKGQRGRTYSSQLFKEAADTIEAQATRIEALEARWTMIDKLRAAEGHSVTIIHDNPDFGGPDCCIHVNESYGQDWTAYFGDTIDDCLRKAVEALEGSGNG